MGLMSSSRALLCRKDMLAFTFGVLAEKEFEAFAAVW